MSQSFSISIPPVEAIYEINLSTFKGIRHLEYKGCRWFINIKDPTLKTVIIFHGARNADTKLPIFRGADFKIPYNLVSISDMLFPIYNNSTNPLLLGWYLSTKKYNNIDTYDEIIKLILTWAKNKVLFTSTSGGAYISLYFASLHRQTALIGNPQIYLEKYPYYRKFKEILTENNDEPVNISILEHFKIKGLPESIIYYINTYDDHHYNEHYMPFQKECLNLKVNLITNKFSIPENSHGNPWPKGKKMIDIICDNI